MTGRNMNKELIQQAIKDYTDRVYSLQGYMACGQLTESELKRLVLEAQTELLKQFHMDFQRFIRDLKDEINHSERYGCVMEVADMLQQVFENLDKEIKNYGNKKPEEGSKN